MKNIAKLTSKEVLLYAIPFLLMLSGTGCTDSKARIMEAPVAPNGLAFTNMATVAPVHAADPDAASILKKPEVPVLCYHQIRDFKPTDSRTAKDYIVPVASFRAQMKLLADSGYHSISPDQLYDYLVAGKSLPSKPVMITFDDTRLDQYTVALPELKKYGFKGSFFIMTVSLGRPGYMSREQVKQLSDEGHTIGSHTWNHENVKKYTATDWPTQVDKPSKQLQEITGKPIEYFAYPFGLWNKEAIKNLKQRRFKMVFQLSDHRDTEDPLMSVRRIIVPGEWSAAGMLRVMKSSFH